MNYRDPYKRRDQTRDEKKRVLRRQEARKTKEEWRNIRALANHGRLDTGPGGYDL